MSLRKTSRSIVIAHADAGSHPSQQALRGVRGGPCKVVSDVLREREMIARRTKKCRKISKNGELCAAVERAAHLRSYCVTFTVLQTAYWVSHFFYMCHEGLEEKSIARTSFILYQVAELYPPVGGCVL